MADQTYFILSVIIFILVYAFIVWDRFDRAVVALSGAILVVLLRIINQQQAFASIDWNTLALLIGMMIIVIVMKRTGIFEFLTIKIVKLSKASPTKLLVSITITTGILSAFLDNVTTILLMLPICFKVTRDLKLNPVPFIIAAVFGSNIGGTATLIGDPPNIMIGSRANLDFMQFLIHDAVICIPLLFAVSLLFALVFRRYLDVDDDLKQEVLSISTKGCIKDWALLKKTLVVFGLVIVGFLFHGKLGYQSSTIALTGAVLLLFVTRMGTEEILKEIEWKTIFFFIGLFVLVSSIEATGVIALLAKNVIALTGGDLFLTTMAILWVSAIASAFMDNIPFVAAMIPLILDLQHMTNMNIAPLWWALSLGACLGGNGTSIGASANVVAIGLAEREGYPINFVGYFKVAFPMMLVTIVACTIYIIFAYIL